MSDTEELLERLTALAAKWDALDMGTGLYPEDSAHRSAHEARAEACAAELRAVLNEHDPDLDEPEGARTVEEEWYE